MEGLTDIISGFDYMIYSGVDPLFDLLANVVGGAIVATIAWIALGRYTAEDIASQIRVGRKNIDVSK
jgi:hypothetical protein